ARRLEYPRRSLLGYKPDRASDRVEIARTGPERKLDQLLRSERIAVAGERVEHLGVKPAHMEPPVAMAVEKRDRRGAAVGMIKQRHRDLHAAPSIHAATLEPAHGERAPTRVAM
ncbi:hypothetical protein ACNJD8_21710, partial [Mycobacterium tuberculosis]